MNEMSSAKEVKSQKKRKHPNPNNFQKITDEPKKSKTTSELEDSKHPNEIESVADEHKKPKTTFELRDGTQCIETLKRLMQKDSTIVPEVGAAEITIQYSGEEPLEDILGLLLEETTEVEALKNLKSAAPDSDKNRNRADEKEPGSNKNASKTNGGGGDETDPVPSRAPYRTRSHSSISQESVTEKGYKELVEKLKNVEGFNDEEWGQKVRLSTDHSVSIYPSEGLMTDEERERTFQDFLQEFQIPLQPENGNKQNSPAQNVPDVHSHHNASSHLQDIMDIKAEPEEDYFEGDFSYGDFNDCDADPDILNRLPDEMITSSFVLDYVLRDIPLSVPSSTTTGSANPNHETDSGSYSMLSESGDSPLKGMSSIADNGDKTQKETNPCHSSPDLLSSKIRSVGNDSGVEDDASKNLLVKEDASKESEKLPIPDDDSHCIGPDEEKPPPTQDSIAELDSSIVIAKAGKTEGTRSRMKLRSFDKNKGSLHERDVSDENVTHSVEESKIYPDADRDRVVQREEKPGIAVKSCKVIIPKLNKTALQKLGKNKEVKEDASSDKKPEPVAAILLEKSEPATILSTIPDVMNPSKSVDAGTAVTVTKLKPKLAPSKEMEEKRDSPPITKTLVSGTEKMEEKQKHEPPSPKTLLSATNKIAGEGKPGTTLARSSPLKNLLVEKFLAWRRKKSEEGDSPASDERKRKLRESSSHTDPNSTQKSGSEKEMAVEGLDLEVSFENHTSSPVPPNAESEGFETPSQSPEPDSDASTGSNMETEYPDSPTSDEPTPECASITSDEEAENEPPMEQSLSIIPTKEADELQMKEGNMEGDHLQLKLAESDEVVTEEFNVTLKPDCERKEPKEAIEGVVEKSKEQNLSDHIPGDLEGETNGTNEDLLENVSMNPEESATEDPGKKVTEDPLNEVAEDPVKAAVDDPGKGTEANKVLEKDTKEFKQPHNDLEETLSDLAYFIIKHEPESPPAAEAESTLPEQQLVHNYGSKLFEFKAEPMESVEGMNEENEETSSVGEPKEQKENEADDFNRELTPVPANRKRSRSLTKTSNAKRAKEDAVANSHKIFPSTMISDTTTENAVIPMPGPSTKYPLRNPTRAAPFYEATARKGRGRSKPINYLKLMISESEKPNPDIDLLLEAMSHTYKSRRKLIEDPDKDVDEIVQKYPALCLYQVVKNEYSRVFNCADKMTSLERSLEVLLDEALRLKPKRFGYKHSIMMEAKKKYEDNPNIDRTAQRVLGMISLAFHFAEKNVVTNLCHILKENEELDHKTALSIVTPKIVCKRSQIYETDAELWIYVETKRYLRVPNFYEGVLAVYAIYYVFNLCYDNKLKALFEFFDMINGNPQSTYTQSKSLLSLSK